MSNFFSGIHGAQFPQVVMNTGPLPSQGGLPAPLHDTADARINYGSTLLGDLNPYAYGQPGFLSSQQGYQNHPHRMHKFIPGVNLPEPAVGTPDLFFMSHPVDDSDIAFCLKLDRRSVFSSGSVSKGGAVSSAKATTVDTFVNLPTLNYILTGLQTCIGNAAPSRWRDLLMALDTVRFADFKHNDRLHLSDILHIVRHRIFPFGIVRGSEKQGGQNETGLSPATWPVGFIAGMVIDGKDRNVNNYWHHMKVDAGDDLVFRLKLLPIGECESYTLNHYYKGIQRRSYAAAFKSALIKPDAQYVWQLVPDKFSLTVPAEEASLLGCTPRVAGPTTKWNAKSTLDIVGYYWQHLGYWHIARSQVMVGAYGADDYYYNDTSHQMFVNHLELTYSPTFTAVPQAPVTIPGRDAGTGFGVTFGGGGGGGGGGRRGSGSGEEDEFMDVDPSSREEEHRPSMAHRGEGGARFHGHGPTGGDGPSRIIHTREERDALRRGNDPPPSATVPRMREPTRPTPDGGGASAGATVLEVPSRRGGMLGMALDAVDARKRKVMETALAAEAVPPQAVPPASDKSDAVPASASDGSSASAVLDSLLVAPTAAARGPKKAHAASNA